jgi:lipopolysaccharide transport system ATP-binding protein
VVGIIGRNGAGKSTLLKILSRITEPTAGRATIRGRVASLLEVGTGFHPELTGRENIFLNGAILGMNKAEIRRKFDEIVAFAEVEEFLDTPVKHYSSGMYVRLAFAVAAHLEPEILIVDEVLAVGDVQFQKKCLGKIQSVVTNEQRTVLLVSHNLQTVRQICGRVIMLHKGQLIANGEPHQTLTRYMGQEVGFSAGVIDLGSHPRQQEHQVARLQRVEFQNPQGDPVPQLSRDTDLRVRVHFTIERPVQNFDIATALVHVEGQRVFSELYSDHHQQLKITEGDYVVQFTLPLRFLKLESYFLVLALSDAGRHCDLVENLPLPELTDGTIDPHIESRRWGYVRMPVAWSPVEVDADVRHVTRA